MTQESSKLWNALFTRGTSSLLRLYPRVFGSPTFKHVNRLMFNLGLRGLGVLNYETIAASGEKWLSTKFLPKICPKVIVDVGANEGQFSILMAQTFPAAKVFAIEPHPLTMARLTENLRLYAGVQAFNCALGVEKSEMDLHDYDSSEGSQHASLYRETITELYGRPSRGMRVNVETLDAFALANSIDRIDFLKIDTEGHEYAVLMGASALLKAGRIGVIQFEFNSLHAVSRVFFRDIVKILPGHVLYRLLPRGLLPLAPYTPLNCEIFAFQNVIAVPKG